MSVTKKPVRFTLWHYVLLAVAAFLFLLPGTASLPPIDRDEARFVQASKQMLESGDYIDIKFQEQNRYKKPVGIYWLQTAAVKLTGGNATSDIWHYRLVSVLAGAGSVLLIALLGTRMFGATAGLAAGIMLAGLFGVAFEGRIAKTDAMLLAITLMAQTALAYIYFAAKDRVPLNKVWPIVLWVAVGIGVLIKGPLTLLIIGLTVSGLVIFDKDRSWLPGLKPLLGLAIVAAISAPWLIAITFKSNGAFWAESVGKDMLGKVSSGQESHGAPPGYYILTYSLYMWPFGYLAILGALKALNIWREPRLLFCLSWYIPFWLLLEALPTKLPHYPLPAYPAVLLLAGWALFGGGQEIALRNWQKWLGWITAFGLGVVSLALAAIAVLGVPWNTGELSLPGILAGTFAVAAGWLASGFGKPRFGLKRVIGATVSATAFYVLAFSFVLPSMNSLWVSRMVAEKLNSIENCENPILAAVDFHEPSLVFLAGTQTKLTDLEGAAGHLIAGGHCALALLPTDMLPGLKQILGSLEEFENLNTISGFNYSKGQETQLELVQLKR